MKVRKSQRGSGLVWFLPLTAPGRVTAVGPWVKVVKKPVEEVAVTEVVVVVLEQCYVR